MEWLNCRLPCILHFLELYSISCLRLKCSRHCTLHCRSPHFDDAVADILIHVINQNCWQLGKRRKGHYTSAFTHFNHCIIVMFLNKYFAWYFFSRWFTARMSVILVTYYCHRSTSLESTPCISTSHGLRRNFQASSQNFTIYGGVRCNLIINRF